MMWVAENIQACLRDFQTGTASMARKRHLHLPQGVFYCFCLMAQIRVQGVQKVQGVQLRPIRVRKKEGELLDGDVGKERLNESAGMRDFLL